MSEQSSFSLSPNPHRGTLEIVAGYLVVGSLWILFSDELAARVAQSKEVLTSISLYKGWGYVVVTSILLYWLIQRHTSRLHASEKQVQRLINALPALISYVGADRRYQFVNNAYADWFSGPLVGRRVEDVLGPSGYQAVSEYIDRVLNGETVSYETELPLPGGERFVSAVYVPDIAADEQVKGYFALIHDVTDQKQSQEELRQWADAFEGCAHGIAIGDPNTNRVSACNPAFARLLQRSVEDINGAAILSLYPPADHEHVRRHVERADQIGHARFETQMVRRDGSMFPVQMDVVSVLGEDGEVLHRVATAQDISEHKQAEERLRASEAKYRTLVEHLPAITYISGPDQYVGVSYISPQIETLGFDLTTWVADPEFWLRQIHPDDQPQVITELERFKAGAEPFRVEYRLALPNGEIRWFHDEARSVRDSSGNVVMQQGFMLDITERKQAEQTLQLQAHWLEKINDAVIISDNNLFIKAWNPAAERIYGWRPEEVIGKRGEDILKSEFFNTTRPQVFQELSETGEFSAEITQLRKDGARIYIETSTVTLRDEKGRVTGYVSVNRDITERRQAEDNRRRFELLSEHSRDIILFVRSDDGRILEANAAALRAYGYSREELLAHSIPDLRVGDPKEIRAQMAQADAGGVLFEATHRRKDGTTFPVEVSAQGVTIRGERTLISIVRDITERKHAEKKLMESEARFRSLFEQSADAILLIEDGLFRDCNPMTVQMMRAKSKADILSRRPYDLSPEYQPDGRLSREKADTMIATALEKGSHRFEWIHTRMDGTEFPVEVLLTSISAGGHPVIHVVWRDITERKQIEAALQAAHDELEFKVRERTAALSEANALLQALMDNMPDHIYFKDTQSRFIRNSRSQATSLGLTDPSEAVGRTDFEFFPHAATSFAAEQEVMRTGKPLVDVEEWVVWPDGRETWVSTTKMQLRNAAGETIGIFGISHDITERKRAEQAIRQLNADLEKQADQLQSANKELEAFSYSVSHDLRAPLRAIDGYTRILVEDYESVLDDEGKRICGVISREARRMGQLIDDLLAFSRLGRKEMFSSRIEMRTLVVSVLNELLRDEDRERFDIHIGNLPVALGDSSLIRQVWVNLLANAIKFTSKKERAVIEIGGKTTKEELTYFVRDNGAGFEMEYADKLFGVFQRLHSESEFTGTGVGLAIVQRIIRRHNGHVWAEGAVDRGATFSFALPRKENHT